MQYGLRARIGLFAATMVIANAVSAVETSQLWLEGNDFIQLATVNVANQHPVKLNAEQLTVMLGQFYKIEKNKEPTRYFSQDEISRVAYQLVHFFAKAQPGQDIEFGTSYRPEGFAFVPRLLNAGRLFIENGQLNLLIGMCGREQDVAYQTTFGNFRPLDHGSRSKPAENAGCELVAGNDTERVNNRTDWLRLNINAALAKTVPVFPNSSLTFGSTSSPDHATLPPAVQLPATATKPVEPTLSAKPALPAAQSPSDLEGRLILLKQLHDKGLITDAEYQQKRALLLKDL